MVSYYLLIIYTNQMAVYFITTAEEDLFICLLPHFQFIPRFPYPEAPPH